MRHLAANALTVLIVLGVAVVGMIYFAKTELDSAGPHQADRTVLLAKGAGLVTVSEALSEAGVIDSPRLFRIGAQYRGVSRSLKFGEYAIPAHASMTEIMDLLVAGRTIQHKITVVEGVTSQAIVELLRKVDVLVGEIAEVPPEGSLAPDTYNVTRGDKRADVLARMGAAQRKRLAAAWKDRAEGLPLKSAEEALVLASIIEKETGVAGERAKVAGVFINRLRKGMRLQSDPTVVYGVTLGVEALGRGLTRKELDTKTPYNTYQIKGLPPTPIASPGAAAITAALRPEATDALYFVADGTGGHAFAKSLREHKKNVAAWRKIEAERAAKE